jgi:hypothetical protein
LAGLAAPSALAAGVLLTLTQLVQLATMDRDDLRATLTNPVYVGNGIAQFAVFSLLLVAAVAAHQWQVERGGRGGVVGLVAALVGTVNLAGNYWFEAFVSPWLAAAAPGYLEVEPAGVLLIGGLSSYTLFAVGWILFGVASLRAKVLPAGVAVAVIVGGLLAVQMVQPPLGVPLGLALTWLGVWMLRVQRSGAR